MEQLVSYLLQFGQLNEKQIALVKAKANFIVLTKNAYFSEAGKISRQLAFVQEGVLRVCFYNNKGEEITHHFTDENHFIVDLNSLNHKVPSLVYIQAVTDCKLIVFTVEGLRDLSSTIITWDDIINKITTKTLLDKVNMIKPMLNANGKTKYLDFLENFPHLINRIPLVLLASYLGITQSSLSRIRRKIK
ncbi:MAG: Crp/Fnr family transcriptional regulator [Flavobacterium sp.]|nr:MAG: Crp/Fnr family transcriptional regulator [Flavobacterium sp.]